MTTAQDLVSKLNLAFDVFRNSFEETQDAFDKADWEGDSENWPEDWPEELSNIDRLVDVIEFLLATLTDNMEAN